MIRQCLCAGALALCPLLAASASAQEIGFTDMAGREVVLAGPAERIVSIIVPTAATVVSIDGGIERLAAVNPGSVDMFRNGVISMYFPDALAIPSNITQPGAGTFIPNVEAIAALAPDVVIQSAYSGDDIVVPLLNAGLNVALYNWGTEEQARQLNEMIGAMIAEPERAVALNAWRAETFTRIAEAAESVQTPVRAVQIAPVENGFRVWGDNTIADIAIELAGGINLASGITSIGVVNLEELVTWDPDVIFIAITPTATRDLVLADPILSTTSAARSGRVYVLPTGTVNWGTAGEDDPLFLSYVAALLYPEIHGHDLVAEMQEWFTFMFGGPLSPEQLASVLKLEQNAGAPYAGALGIGG